MQITNRGRALQAKAQTGTQLQYTRIGIGSGQLAGQSIPNLNGLIDLKMSLPLNKLQTQSGGKAVVGASMSNQSVTTGFYFRELGVYAQDPDAGEILYCYANAGNNAEYIPPGGGPDMIEKQIDVVTLVGNAPNVSAVIDGSLVYATVAQLNAHINDKNNPHAVTKKQIGLENVQNYPVSTQQQAESGTDGASYMTPERTKQAIDKFAPVKSVAGKTGAVSLEKGDVGLGNVENFGIASQGEAEAGTANDKYMTPLRTAQAISSFRHQVTEKLITAPDYNAILSVTPSTPDKMVGVSVYFRVATSTTVAIRIKYTDYASGGSPPGTQYLDLTPSQPYAVGSYTLPVTYVLSKSGTVEVQVGAGVLNQVYASAVIME
ncbi:phage tail-collar fiber domain-containing protein [Paenibacillus tyrfis]|uniref:phage tail-collar fiber domain-containing protein n=1 Tax=Paenibacillus tyrfis TaxID=1501230 RepID=UPI00126A7920|nr:phage tail protein [Paenibacillus tyrfis]